MIRKRFDLVASRPKKELKKDLKLRILFMVFSAQGTHCNHTNAVRYQLRYSIIIYVRHYGTSRGGRRRCRISSQRGGPYRSTLLVTRVYFLGGDVSLEWLSLESKVDGQGRGCR